MTGKLQRIDTPTPPPAPPPPERTRYLVRGTIAPVLIDAHALSPADAIRFDPAHPRDHSQLAAMLRDGSVKRLADGRCWFDMTAYEAAAAARSRRLVPILAVAAMMIAAVAVYFYTGGPLTPR